MSNSRVPLNEILNVGALPANGSFEFDAAPLAMVDDEWLRQMEDINRSLAAFPEELREEVGSLCVEIIRLRSHPVLDLDALWSRLCLDNAEGRPKTKNALKKFLERAKLKVSADVKNGRARRSFYLLSQVKAVLRKKNK